MKDTTKLDYAARIDAARAHLAARCTEDVSPAELAKVARFSLYHFHRVFRGVSGESVMQCQRRLRLERAAQRLIRSDDPIVEIALTSGFGSHEGFTRAFKEHFGATPSGYRAREGARIAARIASSEVAIPDVEIRVVSAMGFLHARHVGSFDEVDAVWRGFFARAARADLYAPGAQLLARHPDDPDITPKGKVRYEVGLVCETRPASLPEGLFFDTIPSGPWAVARHRGPYARLGDTYLALIGGWFPATGRALRDTPCMERYLTSPRASARDAFVTEVWAPIAESI